MFMYLGRLAVGGLVARQLLEFLNKRYSLVNVHLLIDDQPVERTWKDVSGYEDLYEVSSYGEVRPKDIGEIKSWTGSAKEVAKKYGVSTRTIYSIRGGQT